MKDDLGNIITIDAITFDNAYLSLECGTLRFPGSLHAGKLTTGLHSLLLVSLPGENSSPLEYREAFETEQGDDPPLAMSSKDTDVLHVWGIDSAGKGDAGDDEDLGARRAGEEVDGDTEAGKRVATAASVGADEVAAASVVGALALLWTKWLFTRCPAANADMRESSPASTVPATILANWRAFSPGVSLCAPIYKNDKNI